MPEVTLSKTQFIAIIAIMAAIVIASFVVFGNPVEDAPEPPEEQNASIGLNYDYETAEFAYAYLGPENPEETDEVIPERVFIHTTDEITAETRIHEFNPHAQVVQRHEINLREMAEDPDDHLRTLPEIHMTIVYSNGAMETVRTIDNNPQNIESLLKATLSQSHDEETGIVSITPSDIRAEYLTIETEHKQYTVDRDDRQVVRISPEDYYIDTTGDGIYDTMGRIEIVAHYKDVSVTLQSTSGGFYEPSGSIYEANQEGHVVLDVDSYAGHDSITVYTPEGEYILNSFYNPETDEDEGDGESYLQIAEDVGETKYGVLTLKEDVETVKFLIEYEGETYVATTITREDESN